MTGSILHLTGSVQSRVLRSNPGLPVRLTGALQGPAFADLSLISFISRRRHDILFYTNETRATWSICLFLTIKLLHAVVDEPKAEIFRTRLTTMITLPPQAGRSWQWCAG